MSYGISAVTSGTLPPTQTGSSETIGSIVQVPVYSDVTIDNALLVTLFNDFRSKWRSLLIVEQIKTTPEKIFGDTLREIL